MHVSHRGDRGNAPCGHRGTLQRRDPKAEIQMGTLSSTRRAPSSSAELDDLCAGRRLARRISPSSICRGSGEVPPASVLVAASVRIEGFQPRAALEQLFTQGCTKFLKSLDDFTVTKLRSL